MPLAWTKLTCVHYERGDLFGKLLAHSSLLPIAIVVFLAARIHAQRHVHTVFTLAGLVGCEASVLVLKKLIKQPRPRILCEELSLCSSHGMPSSHAAFTVMALCLAMAGARQRLQGGSVLQRAVTVAEYAFLVLASGACIASRVYLSYHSVAQIAAGSAVGLVLGLVWTQLMQLLGRRGAFRYLASLQLAKALHFTDAWGQTEFPQLGPASDCKPSKKAD